MKKKKLSKMKKVTEKQNTKLQPDEHKDSSRIHVTASIKKKLLFTVGIIVCGFCLLVIKLGQISIVKHDEYSKLATSQQLRDTVITAKRGTIYDANMNVLAESSPVWTVAISPNDLDEEDYEVVSQGLADILEVDYQTVLEKCHENNYYSIVKRKVDQPIVNEIRAFMQEQGITNGVSFTEDSKRRYPYGNFAAQMLGFVGVDNQGLSGLESYYDDVLSGTPGRIVTAKNAVGSDMYYDYESRYEPEPGNSLVLTIDEVIQHYLEKHLETAVKEHNVQKRATAIAINVNTGAILGMATKGDFDPNDPFTIFDEAERLRIESITDEEERSAALGEAQQLQWRNKAIADLYEPGSVFKIVTASAALETGAVTLDSHFYCSGSVQVGGHTMHCARTTGHGSEDFLNAVINSCNPAFIDIGQRIGADNFSKYIKAFGFEEKTGIDLPAEAQSITVTRDNMGIVELASCSFGQSNAITPIQMITAVCAAVNGGYLVQPYVVSQVLDSEGNIVESFTPQIKRQVISAETSALMNEIMEQVVINANGQNAYVAGFRIGGKSGTSQKLGGESGQYIASFCAVAPTDDPEIAVLILLDEAHSYSIYGGVLAAPVAGAFMADVLPYLGVDAIYTDEELESADIATPSVTEMSLTNAYAALQRNGLSPQVIGEGTTVVSQFPLAGQSIPRGSTVILYTEDVEEKTVTVPDITGRSIESVRATLKAIGLNLKVTGSKDTNATAYAQSITEGQVVVVGTVVTVEFIGTVDD